MLIEVCMEKIYGCKGSRIMDILLNNTENSLVKFAMFYYVMVSKLEMLPNV